MSENIAPEKLTVGQALKSLRDSYELRVIDVAQFLKTTHTSYSNIEHDKRELTFIMAIPVCQFYNIDVNDLAGMIREEEFGRKELSSLKHFARLEKRKKERMDQNQNPLDK